MPLPHLKQAWLMQSVLHLLHEASAFTNAPLLQMGSTNSFNIAQGNAHGKGSN